MDKTVWVFKCLKHFRDCKNTQKPNDTVVENSQSTLITRWHREGDTFIATLVQTKLSLVLSTFQEANMLQL